MLFQIKNTANEAVRALSNTFNNCDVKLCDRFEKKTLYSEKKIQVVWNIMFNQAARRRHTKKDYIACSYSNTFDLKNWIHCICMYGV